jgi:hypothetical protein
MKKIVLVKIIIITVLIFPPLFFTAAEFDLPDLTLQGVRKNRHQIVSGPMFARLGLSG